MKPSHEVLRGAIEKVGAKTVASELHLSRSLIYKWCQEPRLAEGLSEASGAVNPLDRLKTIYDATHDVELISWLCQAADGFYVENAQDKPVAIEEELVGNTQLLIKEFAETLTAISRSGADDRITRKEAGEIRKEWEDLKRVGEAFVRACEAGRFSRTPSTT